MRKLEIFDEVVKIMREDSSTCKDKGAGNYEKYRCQISEDMGEEDFRFVMKSYIGSFEVPSHLAFGKSTGKTLAFEVRRYQDELYIVKTATNCTLSVGDKIIAVDGVSVKELADKHYEFFYGEEESRQGIFWPALLNFHKEITVIRKENGECITRPIAFDGKWEHRTPYEFKVLNDDITFMRLDDFGDEEAIMKLYADNDTSICSHKYLIIDARQNAGGSDTCFLPILKYCLPEGKKLDDLNLESSGDEVLYSERNVDVRLQMLSAYKEMELPEETLTILNQMEAELIKNRGKGFKPQIELLDIPIVGNATPEKVFILSDCDCGSSGDSFVRVMGMLPKVTVVGRPTMGILDYSNICEIQLDEYTFIYPTSRSLSIDEGKGMGKKGVPVDHFIPWTPKHLEEDIDLNYTLKLCNES